MGVTKKVTPFFYFSLDNLIKPCYYLCVWKKRLSKVEKSPPISDIGWKQHLAMMLVSSSSFRIGQGNIFLASMTLRLIASVMVIMVQVSLVSRIASSGRLLRQITTSSSVCGIVMEMTQKLRQVNHSSLRSVFVFLVLNNQTWKVMDYKIKIKKYIHRPLLSSEIEEWYIVTVREGDKLVYRNTVRTMREAGQIVSEFEAFYKYLDNETN